MGFNEIMGLQEGLGGVQEGLGGVIKWLRRGYYKVASQVIPDSSC